MLLKRLFTIAVLLLFLSPFSTNPKPGASGIPEEADRAAVRAILTAQVAAWNQGNVRSFMQGYWNSPELTFAGSSGFTRGWQAVMTRYEKNYSSKESMGTLDFSELEIRVLSPESALVLGKWRVQRSAGDIGGIFTLVFQKFPEGWRIIHDHTTQIPPAANQTQRN